MNRDQLALRVALTRKDHPQVKLLLHDGTILRISARVALLRAHTEDYEWIGSSGRVRKMRPLKPPPQWIPCHRNSGRCAVLPPSIDWVLQHTTTPSQRPAWLYAE